MPECQTLQEIRNRINAISLARAKANRVRDYAAVRELDDEARELNHQRAAMLHVASRNAAAKKATAEKEANPHGHKMQEGSTSR